MAKKKDTKFKPGQTGNPKGRPKGITTPYTDILTEMLASDKVRIQYFMDKDGVADLKTVNLSSKDKTKTLYYALAAEQLKLALEGDNKAAHDIIDRIQGKPKQALDLSNTDGTMRPVNFEVSSKKTAKALDDAAKEFDK